jgi:chaperonin GroEL (HSP60 family)
MFKNKGMKTTKKPYVVEPKVVNPLIHIVDVNMAMTRSKVIKEQVFKDRKPIKKFAADWEEE